MTSQEPGQLLKCDGLGRVERWRVDGRDVVARIACGGAVPGSGWLARRLMTRERRALERLARLDGVPQLIELSPGSERAVRKATLVRAWVDGAPLSQAAALPTDFFDELDALVARMHAAGVCHNDLHKEQNVLVRPDGRPALVDFQLASRHGRHSWLFRSRVRDDLRHVQKHRKRYLKPGRGPGHLAEERLDELRRGAGHGLRRTPLAFLWRRLGKPVYVFVTRRVLRTRDGEERRPSSGPWPTWLPPVGAAAEGLADGEVELMKSDRGAELPLAEAVLQPQPPAADRRTPGGPGGPPGRPEIASTPPEPKVPRE